MARYWVGGTAAWDGTAGTKWAATSGGAGGESVPTTADDVFFDANSSGICTISAGNTGAKSINCTGFTGTITHTAGVGITVAGSVTLVAGMTFNGSTGVFTFTGTGTLTTAGKVFSAVTVNGSGITLTLGSALNTATRNVTITQGTFDTSNYNVTVNGFISGGSSVRSVLLGSSTVTVSGTTGFFLASTNLTFNAGTSQITIQDFTTFAGANQTFYNVTFSALVIGTHAITGENTFNNLTFSGTLSNGFQNIVLGSSITVNGAFDCSNSNTTRRKMISSNIIGTTRTITAAAISANNCDFRDITIAGAAAPISPTRAGDCGGNSGITFPAAKTVYRVGTNTTWAGSSSWALTSGGTGSNDNFPLAQDTAVIDNNTALTGTLALAVYNIGALDASTRTTGITINYNASAIWHGSHTLGSGVTVSGTSTQTFSGRGTMVFTSAGKTITFPITVDAPGGTFQIGDAFSSSNTITHTQGTFNANNYNLTCTKFSSNNSNVRTITMGSGLWTLSGTGSTSNSPWNIGLSTSNLTFDKGTANILFSDNSTSQKDFYSGGLSYNKFTIGGSGTSVTNIGGSASFTELASTKTVAHTVGTYSNLGTIDTWSITGTAGNIVTFQSANAGFRRSFNLTNVTSGIDYLNVKDIGVNQTDRFYVGANSTDSGNNLNVIFTAAPSTGVFNIFFGSTNIPDIYYGSSPVSAIYYGSTLVFQK
jgi:hypothetical protein